MSYRIWASNHKDAEIENQDRKSHQVYGNNEFPKEVRDYLISKGCKMDQDDCFHDFEIENLQEFLEAMVEAHKNYVEDDSYWDFKPSARWDVSTPYGLISYCDMKVDNAYVFLVYAFYKTFEDMFKWQYDKDNRKDYFVYKDDRRIYLSGY